MLRHKAVKPDSSLAHGATTLENELSLLRKQKHHYHVCSNQHNASGGIWQRVLLVFIVVLIVASNAPFPGLLLQRDSFVTKSVHHHTLNSTQTTGGWIRPTKIYGHVHMAKTAGTDINGELANHYERVCGHKGYSYDALKTNLRTIAAYDKGITGPRLVSADLGESVSKLHPGFNRGTVPERIADEIGYDDCDYISKELDAKVWHRFSRNWEMELHVPCRDPLSHLMSQCNHRHHKFDCDADDLGKEISNCTVEMNRFSMKLQDDPNITLKCFDPVPPSKYVDYMGTILQRKRIESEYFHRDTNNRRNKSDECMWNTGEEFQSRVLSKLMELEYYAYCDLCMGSGGELPLV